MAPQYFNKATAKEIGIIKRSSHKQLFQVGLRAPLRHNNSLSKNSVISIYHNVERVALAKSIKRNTHICCRLIVFGYPILVMQQCQSIGFVCGI